jgi:stress response protein SCP2
MLVLKKTDDAADLDGVTHFSVGVSWDTTAGSSGGLWGKIKKSVGTDLDLIAVACQGNEPVRLAGLDSLDPFGNGSLIHSGDNQSGKGEGDDELVTIDFARVPSNVDSIVFVGAAYKKLSSFENAKNISLKVYDASGGSSTQVADIWPSLLATGNAIRIAKAFRVDSSWQFKVLDQRGPVTQGDEKSLLRFAVGT